MGQWDLDRGCMNLYVSSPVIHLTRCVAQLSFIGDTPARSFSEHGDVAQALITRPLTRGEREISNSS